MAGSPARRASSIRASLALVLPLAVVACGDDPAVVPVYEVAIVGGDGQVGAAESELREQLVVRVRDVRGRPVSGVRVAWTVEEVGGYVSNASLPSITDDRGLARVRRTLGPMAGVFGTLATVDEAASSTVRFVSVAQIQGAVYLVRATDDDGTARHDTVLATLRPYRVIAVDQDHRPVAGVEVYWTSTGGGRLSTKRSITGPDGVGQATHTLGSAAGPHLAKAHVAGLSGSPLVFNATAEAGVPVGIEADDRAHDLGVVAEPLAPFVVRVFDSHGNYVSGVTIEWAVTLGGGVVRPAGAVTAMHGEWGEPYAEATHTLGPVEGANVVTATAPELRGAPTLVFESRAFSAIVAVFSTEACYYYYYSSYCYPAGWVHIFTPTDVIVPVGGTVAWFWACDGDECPAHDVIFADAPAPPISSVLQTGGFHFRTFREVGTYEYRCTEHSAGFHEGMVGVVRVG